MACVKRKSKGAPKGNQFYLFQSSFGCKPRFTPESLWAGAVEYFNWALNNPLLDLRPFVLKGEIVIAEIPKPRALTVGGLCIFIDISMQCWSEYKTRAGFEDVTSKISEVIRTQKFEGAAVDIFNAAIVMRDLGLTDKTELTGKDGGPIKTEEVTDDAARARALAGFLARTKPPES